MYEISATSVKGTIKGCELQELTQSLKDHAPIETVDLRIEELALGHIKDLKALLNATKPSIGFDIKVVPSGKNDDTSVAIDKKIKQLANHMRFWDWHPRSYNRIFHTY